MIGPLFDWSPPPQVNNAEHLERVKSRIGSAVLEFCRDRMRRFGGRFHASDLHEAVNSACGAAPASADRVLRALRQQGALAYVVESRSESLYLVRSVAS